MKKKILIPIIIAAGAVVAVAIAFTIFIIARNNKENSVNVEIPYVSDFTCDYYDENVEIIYDKKTVFEPGDEIRVKTNFTLLPDAYAEGKGRLTVKFILSADFTGKIVSANSSATSDKDLTAMFTTDDKKSKKCEIEMKVNVNYSSGSFRIVYAYDDEEYTEACELPLNNNKTLLYTYDEETGGYIVSRDSKNFEWLKNTDKVVLCDSFEGNPVTVIGAELFSDCSNLTSVEIPDSIMRIKSGAFDGCDNLRYNEYENAKYLGNEQNLYVVFIKPINTDITSIKINEAAKVIYGGAFNDCSSLSNITIPDSVVSIEARAFQGCGELTSVTIPNGVTRIDDYVFADCNKLTDITIPDSVIYIWDYAFSSCDSLTNITIPNSVICIGDYAFSGCTNLTDITIPDSITIIEERAFEGCNNLKYNEYGNAKYLGNKQNPYVVFIKSMNTDITSIKINESAKIIYNDAFSSCGNLTSVTIPDSVTYIGERAFYDCKSLTDITISDSVMGIGGSAFEDCGSLISVNINDIVAWCNIEFGFSDSNPMNNGAELRLNGKLIENLVIPDGITKIKSYSFCGCNSLTSVSMPDSVTSIGWSAFEECSNLTSVTIPDSVTSIGGSAFHGCSSLASITISDGVTNIGYGAFDGCSSLTSIIIPNGVTEIREYAFYGCSSLTSIIIPDSVTSIGRSAFYGCSSITDIIIPVSVTYIGIDAFCGCSSLTNITIPDGVMMICASAFYNCRSLTSVTIPDSVTSIGGRAFQGCSSLKSVFFDGTKSKWKSISSNAGESSDNGNVTIKCTDGELNFKFYG